MYAPELNPGGNYS